MPVPADIAIWAIAGLATAGVILRPFRWPEAVWAVAGAVLLVVTGLLSPGAALQGVGRGTDVYLFLIGMMLLAEIARLEGLFDWLAAHAATLARGSATRLFTLIYLVGVLVTVFLSNDATAVVLTPAVAAVTRAVRCERPLPYLLICAFIANAASFVLPISNPANLVIYSAAMPPLWDWLRQFALPSLLAIVATYGLLWLTQRDALRQSVSADVAVPTLSQAGRTAAIGIVGTAFVLMAASAFGGPLGASACLAGVLTATAVLLRQRRAPWTLLSGIAWSVLPLVAGLFVLVAALSQTGALGRLAMLLRDSADHAATASAWGAAAFLAAACNLVNNLPAGLIAGAAVQSAHAPPIVSGGVLIGIDLGPNLSVTGSLATILWLNALRREGQEVGAWSFLKLGMVIMPAALVLAMAALTLF